MKQFTLTSGAFLIIIALLSACTGNPETKEQKTETTKKLSLEQKTRNTLENTIIVFSGSMLVVTSSHFRDHTQAMAEIFDSELNNENLKVLDEQIANLGEETINSLEKMMADMDAAFDTLEKENLTVYEKIFLHDIMKEGVTITEKYKLQEGFRPLSQNLTQDELKRYILKVTVDGEDSEDPVIKTYIELFGWFQKVGQELSSDPDFEAFVQNLR